MADSGDETDAASAGAWDESLPPAVPSLADELLPICKGLEAQSGAGHAFWFA